MKNKKLKLKHIKKYLIKKFKELIMNSKLDLIQKQLIMKRLINSNITKNIQMKNFSQNQIKGKIIIIRMNNNKIKWMMIIIQINILYIKITLMI